MWKSEVSDHQVIVTMIVASNQHTFYKIHYYLPDIMMLSEDYVRVDTGDTVTLSCAVQNYTTANLQWYAPHLELTRPGNTGA